MGFILLIFTGFYLSVKLDFFQFKNIRLWLGESIADFWRSPKSGDKGGISPFQSVCTSLAACLGVGNIVGVGTAICLGGPGAVFWMWIAAFIGMIISYSENVLGMYFRTKTSGSKLVGGAVYYIKCGIPYLGKTFACMYAVFTIFASFGIGSMSQINSIVTNIKSAFPIGALDDRYIFDSVNIYSLIIGVIVFIPAVLVVFGGIKRIAAFTEKLVPIMIVFFVLGSMCVILNNISRVFPAFKSIFFNAFNFRSFGGGISGSVFIRGFRQGFQKGVFSNEAGMGSSVSIHTEVDSEEPCKQGMLGIFEVFVDTIFLCTVTALVVLCSGVYDSAAVYINDASTIVAQSFDTILPFMNFGGKFVAVSIFLFAFSSCIAWSYYGVRAWEYLFGAGSVFWYKSAHLLSFIPGAVLTTSVAWDISDIFNGLMLFPNLIAVLMLSGLTKRITDNYLARKNLNLSFSRRLHR